MYKNATSIIKSTKIIPQHKILPILEVKDISVMRFIVTLCIQKVLIDFLI